MMNLDVLPPLPHHADVVKALELLSDPAAARKLYDSLKDGHAKASAAYAEATKLQQEVKAQREAHAADVIAFEQNRKAHGAYLADAGEQLDQRETGLRQERHQLDADKAAHQAAVDAHNAKVAAFHDRLAKFGADIRATMPA